MKMAVIEMSCAGTCGRAIRVTDTSSLYQPDGAPHQIFCSHCYHEKGNIMSTVEDFENAPAGAAATHPRIYRERFLLPSPRWRWVARIQLGYERSFPTHAQALQWVREQLKETEA